MESSGCSMASVLQIPHFWWLFRCGAGSKPEAEPKLAQPGNVGPARERQSLRKDGILAGMAETSQIYVVYTNATAPDIASTPHVLRSFTHDRHMHMAMTLVLGQHCDGQSHPSCDVVASCLADSIHTHVGHANHTTAEKLSTRERGRVTWQHVGMPGDLQAHLTELEPEAAVGNFVGNMKERIIRERTGET